MQMVQQGYSPKVLINMMNENGKISRSHALPQALLQQQADAMNLPLLTKPSSWEEYEMHFVNTLLEAKEKYKIGAMVFGDIDLQSHRDWEEKVCAKAGLQAFLPLWQKDRKELVLQMLQQGIETMVVSCNNTLGEYFLGKIITPQLITELELKGVDVCGENGEFHTLVINCPLYNKPLQLPEFSTVQHGDYWFVQWKEQ
jgi:uncharacterized protein (TIGR00290 family)